MLTGNVLLNRVRRRSLLLAVCALPACATVHNYGPDGPRYAGVPTTRTAAVHSNAAVDTLRVVSFNIAFAREIDSAIAVLRDPALADADIVLLQEMDAAGTARIAASLGLHYVYYPATLHPRTGRDFGNAVLSRWPIVADGKILLPHTALVRLTRRTATAATIQAGDTRIRVYSAHLGTIVDVTPAERRSQFRTILDDAAPYDHVIIGGDMNDPAIGRIARDVGYDWPTRHGPRTSVTGARVDHIFLRGLAPGTSAASGTVAATRNASDHRPVWAIVELR